MYFSIIKDNIFVFVFIKNKNILINSNDLLMQQKIINLFFNYFYKEIKQINLNRRNAIINTKLDFENIKMFNIIINLLFENFHKEFVVKGKIN